MLAKIVTIAFMSLTLGYSIDGRAVADENGYVATSAVDITPTPQTDLTTNTAVTVSSNETDSNSTTTEAEDQSEPEPVSEPERPNPFMVRPEYMDDEFCQSPFCTMEYSPHCDQHGNVYGNRCDFLINKWCPDTGRNDIILTECPRSKLPDFMFGPQEADSSHTSE